MTDSLGDGWVQIWVTKGLTDTCMHTHCLAHTHTHTGRPETATMSTHKGGLAAYAHAHTRTHAQTSQAATMSTQDSHNTHAHAHTHTHTRRRCKPSNDVDAEEELAGVSARWTLPSEREMAQDSFVGEFVRLPSPPRFRASSLNLKYGVLAGHFLLNGSKQGGLGLLLVNLCVHPISGSETSPLNPKIQRVVVPLRDLCGAGDGSTWEVVNDVTSSVSQV
jgi:hypothetical protein